MPRSRKKRKRHKPEARSRKAHNQKQPTKRKSINFFKIGDYICIRKQRDASGYIKRVSIKKRSYLIQFKNGAFAWYNHNKVSLITEEEYKDAASDFEIDKTLPSPSPTPSLTASPTPSVTPSLTPFHSPNPYSNPNPNPPTALSSIQMECNDNSEIEAMNQSDLVPNPQNIESENEHQDDSEMEVAVDSNEVTINQKMQSLAIIESETVNDLNEVEDPPLNGTMAAVCDPMESGTVSDSEEPHIVLDEEVDPHKDDEKMTESVDVDVNDGDKEIECLDAIDDAESKEMDPEDAVDVETEEENVESTNVSDDIEEEEAQILTERKQKSKKRKMSEKTKKKKKKKGKNESVTLASLSTTNFERKMKMYYKVSDLRERAFLIMCDESKRIDVDMLYGYIRHFGGGKEKVVKKEVKQFFDFMKPNANQMVTFSKFVRAIDDDGDVVAAMHRFLKSGHSRSKSKC